MSVLGRWTAHSQAQTQSIREGAGFDEDNEKKQMKLGEHYNSITAQLDVSENIRKRNHKTGDGLDSSHQPDSGTQIIVRELHGKIRELNFSLMAHSALDSFDDLSDACSPNLEHTLKGRVCWTVSEVGGVPTVPNVASSSQTKKLHQGLDLSPPGVRLLPFHVRLDDCRLSPTIHLAKCHPLYQSKPTLCT